MIVPKMPAEIIDLLDFEKDMTAICRLIQNHRRMVKLKCPHDLALDRLHEALLATLRDVTGEATAPWAEDAAVRQARRLRNAWPFATASWWLNVALLRSSLGHYARCEVMSFSINRPAKPTAVQNDIERRAKLIDETLVQVLSMMDADRARAFAEEYTAIIIGRDRPEHLASIERALEQALRIRSKREG